jgi:nitronate monooxygenase
MPWRDTPFARRVGLRVPVVQAPMAGGSTTPRLVAAVCEAGGLGSIAGAMLSPDDVRRQVREVRSLTARPFAVNLFAPLPPPSTERTAEWAALLGVAVPGPRPAPSYDDQLAVVVEERVPVFSFTFGAPPVADLDAFTVGTATTPAEAVELERAGADAVVAQGFEAGGHRGSFLDPAEESLVGTLALVPQVVDAVSVPVLAAGGVMDGRGVAAVLALGAQGAQLGTAFLATAEAATSAAHRRALATRSTVTDVLTGRHARAARTPLVESLEESGLRPPDYPLPRQFLTEPPYLYGQGGPMARSLPAGALVARLEEEADAVLRSLAGPGDGMSSPGPG